MSLNVILSTPTHKVESAGVLKAVVTEKLVSPKTIIQLFPDEAIADLFDFANTKANMKASRGKAIKAQSILSQSEPIDVLSAEFDTLLIWAKDTLGSFDQTDIDAIKLALGI